MSETTEYIHTQDIPEAVRKECLQRDGYKCRRCGNEDNLTLHHVVPRGRQGKHIPENLVTVCWYKCHRMLEEHEIAVKLINRIWYFTR